MVEMSEGGKVKLTEELRIKRTERMEEKQSDKGRGGGMKRQ